MTLFNIASNVLANTLMTPNYFIHSLPFFPGSLKITQIMTLHAEPAIIVFFVYNGFLLRMIGTHWFNVSVNNECPRCLFFIIFYNYTKLPRRQLIGY